MLIVPLAEQLKDWLVLRTFWPRGSTQPGISCQKSDLASKARTSILRVGRIKSTSLAHE
jgi:hypothetical protein